MQLAENMRPRHLAASVNFLAEAVSGANEKSLTEAIPDPQRYACHSWFNPAESRSQANFVAASKHKLLETDVLP